MNRKKKIYYSLAGFLLVIFIVFLSSDVVIIKYLCRQNLLGYICDVYLAVLAVIITWISFIAGIVFLMLALFSK